jgi:hypothetical protein
MFILCFPILIYRALFLFITGVHVSPKDLCKCSTISKHVLVEQKSGVMLRVVFCVGRSQSLETVKKEMAGFI